MKWDNRLYVALFHFIVIQWSREGTTREKPNQKAIMKRWSFNDIVVQKPTKSRTILIRVNYLLDRLQFDMRFKHVQWKLKTILIRNMT